MEDDVPVIRSSRREVAGGQEPDDPLSEVPEVLKPKKSRSGRNLPAAIGVALVLIALVVAGLSFHFGTPPRPWGFIALMVVAVTGALWEFGAGVLTEDIQVARAPLLVGGFGIVISAYTAGVEALFLAFALTAGAAFIWRLLDGAGPLALRDASVSILAVAYIPFLAGFVSLMLAMEDGPWRVGIFIALAVANDTGGYIAGVLFGKHPMAPKVSPKNVPRTPIAVSAPGPRAKTRLWRSSPAIDSVLKNSSAPTVFHSNFLSAELTNVSSNSRHACLTAAEDCSFALSRARPRDSTGLSESLNRSRIF